MNRLFDRLPLMSITLITTTAVFVMHSMSITLNSLVLLVFNQFLFAALFPLFYPCPSHFFPLCLPFFPFPFFPTFCPSFYYNSSHFRFTHYFIFSTSSLSVITYWFIAKFTLDQSHFILVFDSSQNRPLFKWSILTTNGSFG